MRRTSPQTTKNSTATSSTVVAVSATSVAGASVPLVNGAVSYDPGDLFQHLNDGETATDTFTYTVDDGKGGTDTATVTVTINGVTRTVTPDRRSHCDEPPPQRPASAAADVDNDDGFQAVSDQSSAWLWHLQHRRRRCWTYTLDNGNAAVDALGDGETLTDSFMALTVDGTQQEITVTINGSDDARDRAAHQRNPLRQCRHRHGEFIEVRVAAGADVRVSRRALQRQWRRDLRLDRVSGLAMTTDGEFDYYVWNLPVNGIQNGSPDGVALSQNGTSSSSCPMKGRSRRPMEAPPEPLRRISASRKPARKPLACRCSVSATVRPVGRPASADAGRRQ